ncbi:MULTISPECIES: hypothetical protein [Pseudoalteromonas]|uniref:Uncharacterized protein n=1 Tax=Pseudoalteromonas obscura TaxID=3048491 RepID=A0ABT7EK55_9GAMM|nr:MULTISPECIES: hypothetical protein [Pseudoalteromonas]MBQ4837335.1 hypothetical protein [Pseudoalteromonas luteoviolacea]MDK2595441.1 hypothetical protein [Pseudoalteromonas sp. P94(2023)]
MFAYEKFAAIYDAISYMLIPIYVISMLVAWKNINIRYLIGVVLAIEIFDVLTLKFAFSLGNNFYLWAIVVNVLFFFVPVLGRRLIAANLRSRFKVFEKIYLEYNFTRQEGGLIFLYALATLVCFMAFIEASLYTAEVITVFPIIENIYGPVASIAHMLEAFLILSLAMKGKWGSIIGKADKPNNYSSLKRNV